MAPSKLQDQPQFPGINLYLHKLMKLSASTMENHVAKTTPGIIVGITGILKDRRSWDLSMPHSGLSSSKPASFYPESLTFHAKVFFPCSPSIKLYFSFANLMTIDDVFYYVPFAYQVISLE